MRDAGRDPKLLKEGTMAPDPVVVEHDSDIKLITMMFEPETLGALTGTEPQRVYHELAQRCPVLKRPGARVTMLKMDEILELTRNRSVLGNGNLDSSMGGAHKLIPLDLDGPRHTHYRKLLDPVFAPRKMALLEPKVREMADRLIDTFIDNGEAELFGAFCQPLPSSVFLSIMGIPQSDLAYFLEFKDGILRHDADETIEQSLGRRDVAGVRCRTYFTELWEERAGRDDNGEDLIGWLMSTEVEGETLSQGEFVEICLLLMIAGLDTVSASMSCLLSWLARHPEERRWICEDDRRWPAAIEELMRFESPVPQAFRQTTEDIEIGGTTYAAGTRFMVSWPAANLDPDVFQDPLTVKLDRSPNRHVVFASGIDRCLGSHLARTELRVALQCFHRRIPDYQVRPGTELTYIPLGVRQVIDLPVIWPG
jgi:cytochrome P450